MLWKLLNDDDKTWLECYDLSKNGFQIQLVNRKDRREGGLALMSTTNIKIKLLENGEKSSFEYLAWKASTNNSSITLLAIYHPHHHRLTIQHIPVFLEEFADYMENLLTTNHNIVIAGDFNLNINNWEDPEAQLFTDMIDTLGLDCHINFPTHQSGHNLDLVSTESLNEMKIIRCIPGTYLSDHCTIECLLSLKSAMCRGNRWSTENRGQLIQQPSANILN